MMYAQLRHLSGSSVSHITSRYRPNTACASRSTSEQQHDRMSPALSSKKANNKIDTTGA